MQLSRLLCTYFVWCNNKRIVFHGTVRDFLLFHQMHRKAVSYIKVILFSTKLPMKTFKKLKNQQKVLI